MLPEEQQFAVTAGLIFNRDLVNVNENTVLMLVEENGGTNIETVSRPRGDVCLHVRNAEKCLLHTANVNIVHINVMGWQGERKMSEYLDRVVQFRKAMSVIKELLLRGIISPKDYFKIEKLLAKKYALNKRTIFSDNA